MKTNSILLTFALIFSSCYTYKSFDAEEYAAEMTNGQDIQQNSIQAKKLSREEISQRNQNNKSNNRGQELISVNAEVNISTKPKVDISSFKMNELIQPDKFYKVSSEGKEYTIEAKQWKADTLYAVVKGTEKELKFHQKDISDLKIRKFSKGKSDALTIAAYALGGVGVFLLLK